MRKEMGQRVAELRKKRGLSQGEMGKVLGVSHSAVSNKESGESAYAPEELGKIVQYFGVTYEWIFTGRHIPSQVGENMDPEEEGLLETWRAMSLEERLMVQSLMLKVLRGREK